MTICNQPGTVTVSQVGNSAEHTWGLSASAITGGCLGGQLDLNRPHLPGVRAGLEGGPVDLGVGDVLAAPGRGPVGAQPSFGMPPRPPRRPDRAGLQPEPGGQDRADVGQAAQRRLGGGEPEPGRGHPGPGQPAPPRPLPQPPRLGVPGPPPPRHDRRQPVRSHPQRQGEQIVRGAVMLPAQQQPVDVALAEPDRARVGAPRGPGRGDGVEVSRHDVPKVSFSHTSLCRPACPEAHGM
jgi:hypothetical protein